MFKPHVDSMLRRFDDGIAAVGQFMSPETGTVAVAFQQSLGTWLVPDLVRSFRARHPDVQFRLTQVRDELHGLPLDGGIADLEIGTRRFRTSPEVMRPGDLRGADGADRHRAAAAGAAPRPPAQRAAARPAEGRGQGAVHRPAVDLGAAEAGV